MAFFEDLEKKESLVDDISFTSKYRHRENTLDFMVKMKNLNTKFTTDRLNDLKKLDCFNAFFLTKFSYAER